MWSLWVYEPNDATDVFPPPPPAGMKIRDFLASPPSWRPNPSHMLLAFDALSAAQNDALNRLGELDHIVPQLFEAGERLRAGRFALLRDSVYHQPTWYLFEPHGPGTCFSVLGALAEPFGNYFPSARSPFHAPGVTDQRAAVYEHVTRTREALDARVLLSGRDASGDSVLPTTRLADSFVEQAALGERLSALLAAGC